MRDRERDFYNRADLWTEEYWDPVQRDRAERTAALIPDEARLILDLGAGPGILGLSLQDRGKEIVSADIALVPLAQATGHKVGADARHLPFRSASFDAVIAGEIVEHLRSDALESAVEEIARVTRSFVVISVPYREAFESSLVRCKNCGHVFHPDFHARSFDEARLALLLSPHFTFRRSVLLGPPRPYVPVPIARMAHTFGVYRNVSTAICDECGFSLLPPDPGGPVDRPYKRSLLTKVLKKVTPRRKATWIAALYERSEISGSPASRGSGA